MKTIGLVFGGKSVEHDVSVISAQIISKGFESLKNKFKLVPIYINKKGNWFPFSAFPPLETPERGKDDNVCHYIVNDRYTPGQARKDRKVAGTA